MPFLRYTEDRGYIVCATAIVVQYVDFLSSSLDALRSDFVVFDKSVDWLHVDSRFDKWVEEIMFECRLRALLFSCRFISWHCSDVYAGHPLISLELFAPVPDWRRAYGFS